MENDDNFILSEDPLEHFKIENEILKMQLKAQYGESFQMFSNGEDLPPQIENQFLKNMIDFEANFKNVEFITIREKLGNPYYTKLENINLKEVKNRLQNLVAKLNEKEIFLEFIHGPYDDKIIYHFITEELLDKEIEKKLPDGSSYKFIYEEFHPNHKEDLYGLAHIFLTAWATKQIEQIEKNLTKNLVDIKGEIFTKRETIIKVENFFNAFEKFTNEEFYINSIEFTISEDEETGTGNGNGNIKFDAIMENGEPILYEGNFKLKFIYEFGYWNVCHFDFPGFNW